MTLDVIDIAANMHAAEAEIAAAARSADRNPRDITLVAVGKTHGPAVLDAALVAGHRVFGENRVQEAKGKWPELRTRYPDLQLHLIGPLQSNKVRDAVELFDVIETVDRPKLARALAREMEVRDLRRDCMVQVNTGEEPQKAGVHPEEADALVRMAIDECGLSVTGLMCVPPIDDEPSLHFALLREIARRHGLPRLSMGMSADFPIAIQFGATHVRIGTAIFGPRGSYR